MGGHPSRQPVACLRPWRALVRAALPHPIAGHDQRARHRPCRHRPAHRSRPLPVGGVRAGDTARRRLRPDRLQSRAGAGGGDAERAVGRGTDRDADPAAMVARGGAGRASGCGKPPGRGGAAGDDRPGGGRGRHPGGDGGGLRDGSRRRPDAGRLARDDAAGTWRPAARAGRAAAGSISVAAADSRGRCRVWERGAAPASRCGAGIGPVLAAGVDAGGGRSRPGQAAAGGRRGAAAAFGAAGTRGSRLPRCRRAAASAARADDGGAAAGAGSTRSPA